MTLLIYYWQTGGRNSMRYKKVGYGSVNSICVIDDEFKRIILKKPKRRYRTIIRAFYRWKMKQENTFAK